ncbi:T9SS type A sorting domain-containing protein, partial [Bacteroidales bacterium OttesenSCG-928-K22]|nr:T9SS type A sorting domain-containing protein [Bacteroidales bacterium OttesenSCG-928-K22]
MKKIFTFCFLLVVSLSLIGQKSTVHLSESFNGTSIPTGWTFDTQASNWSVSNSVNAGGEPRELKLYWSPQFNGKTRFISPVIDLTDVDDLIFEFIHFLDNYSGSSAIGVETTSDGGTTWNLAFQKNFSVTGGGKIMELIDTDDVGSATFQFCLFYQGNVYNINNWYFDNFVLYSRDDVDAAISTINNDIYNPAGEHTVDFTFNNIGKNTINSIEASYQFNDAPAVVETFSSLDLETLNSKTLSFTEVANIVPGSYILKIEILKVNGNVDNDITNNVLEKDFFSASQATDRRVCIEHFTSSTCGPCVSPNAQMKSLLANNPDKYGISKYQMSWPGSGDPYYTEEGGVRRSYYGVNAVPQIYFNGKEIAGVNQTNFDLALAQPAFVDLSGGFVMEGTTINVSVRVDTYIDMPEARLYVVVNEKKTTQNVGSNGETEFIHVMMKFLPNAEGTTISMLDGETQIFNFSYDMSSTNVEEYDDLEVHVFIQEYSSKYIFNSNFLVEQEEIAEKPQEINLEQDETSVNVSWVDAAKGANSFIVFFNGEVIEEGITATNYTHENVPEGLHTYGVSAVIDNFVSIPIEKTIEVIYVGLQGYDNMIKVYPNPANDYVYVEGKDVESVRIYNNLGQFVKIVDSKNNIIKINTNNLNSGLYHLQITTKSGDVST